MTGRTVVITGGNSGIGLETAVALAAAGARTVITARDPARGRAALEQIGQRSGSSAVELAHLDLANLDDVRASAAVLLEQVDRLDVLINNAGVVLSRRRLTADGLEATFATNHLGPFLLTNLLMDRLLASAPARVVNVSSAAHVSARHGIDFDDLQSERA